MNKEHWITFVLERTDIKEGIYDLIELSYNLTRNNEECSS